MTFRDRPEIFIRFFSQLRARVSEAAKPEEQTRQQDRRHWLEAHADGTFPRVSRYGARIVRLKRCNRVSVKTRVELINSFSANRRLSRTPSRFDSEAYRLFL